MRTLYHVDEFKNEASKALFTKRQAIMIANKLLIEELAEYNNSNQDVEVLKEAMLNLNSSFLDIASTKTDLVLDSANVARLTAEDICLGLETIIYEISQSKLINNH